MMRSFISSDSMKLRFRKNSLRFRLNQVEVIRLASGEKLIEEIWFPGADRPFRYSLGVRDAAAAELGSSDIAAWLSRADVIAWARSGEMELHRSIATGHDPLKLMVEKDLVCVDGPDEERDPDAFPRAAAAICK